MLMENRNSTQLVGGMNAMRTRVIGYRGGLAAVLCATVVAAWFPDEALANGYRILGLRGVRAIGMGEAFVAQADDPSAVAFNPAGLLNNTQRQVSAQAAFCKSFTEHEAADGTITKMDDEWQTVPCVYLAAPLKPGATAFGLGLSYPNGMSTDWGDDSFAKYVTTYSRLTVADISPAFAVMLPKQIEFGCALNVYRAHAQLERMVDAGLVSGRPPLGLPVNMVLEGDGTGVGATLGFICPVAKKHSLGFAYRSSFGIRFDGDYTVGPIAYDSRADVDFPEVLTVGYAWKPMTRLVVECDLDLTRWGRVGDIDIDFKSPLLPDTALAQSLHDTCTAKIGLEYLATDAVALRCGYIYNENATDEATWRPSLPDTLTHFMTAGAGVRAGSLTVDTALQVVLYEDRSIDNNVDLNEFVPGSSIDGTYRTWAPTASVGISYLF